MEATSASGPRPTKAKHPFPILPNACTTTTVTIIIHERERERERKRERERERERKNHPTTTNRWANSSHLNLTVKTVTVAGKSPEEEQQLIKNDVHRLLVSKPRNIFGQEISTV